MSTGTFLRQWGVQGSGDGQFSLPKGVAVDGSGNVYVTDAGNGRIQKFKSDGTFMKKWNSDSYNCCGQFAPRGITIDSSAIYVVNGLNTGRVVHKFTKP